MAKRQPFTNLPTVPSADAAERQRLDEVQLMWVALAAAGVGHHTVPPVPWRGVVGQGWCSDLHLLPYENGAGTTRITAMEACSTSGGATTVHEWPAEKLEPGHAILSRHLSVTNLLLLSIPTGFCEQFMLITAVVLVASEMPLMKEAQWFLVRMHVHDCWHHLSGPSIFFVNC